MNGTTASPKVRYPDRKQLAGIERAVGELHGKVERVAWDLGGALEFSDGVASPALPVFSAELYGWLVFMADYVRHQTDEVLRLVDEAVDAGNALMLQTVLEREHQERLAQKGG